MKRLLAIMIAAVMAVTLLPVMGVESAYAENLAEEDPAFEVIMDEAETEETEAALADGEESGPAQVELKDGDSLTITEESEFFFNPAETGGYEFHLSAEGQYDVIVNFYEKYSSEWEIVHDLDFNPIRDQSTYEYSLDAGYPFFAEAGKEYKFELWFYGSEGIPASFEVSLGKSDKAGITDNGLKYTTVNYTDYQTGENYDAVQIIGYVGTDTAVTVPSTIHDVPVKTIGDRAFGYIDTIESLIFEEGITQFQNYICMGCSSLKHVELPSTLQSIYNNPFEFCPIEEIIVADGGICKYIDGMFIAGDELLAYYGSAEEATVPDGVRSIGSYAFSSCVVKKLTLPKSVVYCSRLDDDNLEELHIQGSYCYLDDLALAYTTDENNHINGVKTTVYLPKDGTIKLGVYYDFVFPNQGTALIEEHFADAGISDQIIYEGTAEKEQALTADGNTREYSRYRDGYYYLKYTAEKTGQYYFFKDEASEVESLTDSDGNDVPFGTETEWSSRNLIILNEGTVYVFKLKCSDEDRQAIAFALGFEKEIAASVSILDTVVSEIPDAVYTGKEITPKPEIFYQGERLIENKDYVLRYENNIDAGTASLIIEGLENYCDSRTIDFTISPAAQKITASVDATSIAVGKTATITASAKGKLSYKTADTAIATVNSKGVIKGVKVGTVKITVTAAAADNYKKATKTFTIKVVPAATSSVSAANLATGMKVSWKKVTGATGYYVYRKDSSGSYAQIKKITSGSTVSYTDKAANTNGNKYTYNIVAYAGTGKSTLSKTLATYKIARPAISSLTSSTAKKAVVKWGKNAKANGYEIQFSLKSDFSTIAKTKTITKAGTVSWAQTGLTSGKTYYVRIRTYKTVSGKEYNSAWSAVKKIKVK